MSTMVLVTIGVWSLKVSSWWGMVVTVCDMNTYGIIVSILVYWSWDRSKHPYQPDIWTFAIMPSYSYDDVWIDLQVGIVVVYCTIV